MCCHNADGTHDVDECIVTFQLGALIEDLVVPSSAQAPCMAEEAELTTSAMSRKEIFIPSSGKCFRLHGIR